MTFSWDGCLSQLLGFHQNEVGKCPWDQFETGTLPETNIAAENMLQKKETVFQPSIFSCYVSFREGIQLPLKIIINQIYTKLHQLLQSDPD